MPTTRLSSRLSSFLEYLRCQEYSPNTVKSYARALAMWWTFLERRDHGWERVDADDVAAFVRAVRTCSVESRAPLAGRAMRRWP